jgi:hypothetical protein
VAIATAAAGIIAAAGAVSAVLAAADWRLLVLPVDDIVVVLEQL